MLSGITHPELSYVAATLCVCLLFVTAMAAITRDRESIRMGAGLALAFAAICALANIDVWFGWLGFDVLIATLFGWFAQSQQRSFRVWFGICLVFGLLIAFLSYRLVAWLRGRRNKYVQPAPQPA
jgi:hypothetical protein